MIIRIKHLGIKMICSFLNKQAFQCRRFKLKKIYFETVEIGNYISV